MTAPDPWFEAPAELVEHLRALHRRAYPTPRVRGFRRLLLLQSGGQGSVYHAVRVQDDRPLALKVFHDPSFDSDLQRRRFEREIQLVARLRHPGVVRLFSFGRTQEGRPYLAMEYVAGMRLSEYVRGRPVPQVLDLILQVCAALIHAHRRGVLHRDIKPGNIRVDPSGRVRLLDFGLARPLNRGRGRASARLSATGAFLGTLQWASPEQLRGHPDELDTRSDIYSLGLVLHEALTGEMPYSVEGSIAEIARNIEEAPPTPLRVQRPDASADLETIVLRCLAKEPHRRYPSVAALALDLERVLRGEPIGARRDGWPYRVRRAVRRHPVASVAIAAVSLLLCLTTLHSVRSATRSRSAEAQAREALRAEQTEVERVARVNEFLLGSFTGLGIPAETESGSRGDLRLRDVLESAAERIEADVGLRDAPEVRADLHLAFAYWFSTLPEADERARWHVGHALELYDALDDVALTQLAWALELRGTLEFQAGQHAQALEDLAGSRERYIEAGADRWNLVRVAGPYASSALAMGRTDGLPDILREARDIAVERVGETHPTTLEFQRALEHLRGLEPSPADD